MKIQLALVILCIVGGAALAEEPTSAEPLTWFAVEISVGSWLGCFNIRL